MFLRDSSLSFHLILYSSSLHKMIPMSREIRPRSTLPRGHSTTIGDTDKDQEVAIAPVTNQAEPQKLIDRRSSLADVQSEDPTRLRSYGDGHGFACVSHGNEDNPAEESKRDEEQDYEVRWDGDGDPMNPHSLSKARRWLIVVIVSMGSTCV